MQTLSLTENVQSDPVTLPGVDVEYLSGERFRYNFILKLTSSGTRIFPDSIVGSFRLPSGMTINVRPKLPLPNVFKMLSYVEGLNWHLSGKVGLNDDHGLFDILAAMFADELNLLLRHGLRLGYSSREESLRVVRGRVLLDKTLTRELSRPDRLVCRYDRLSSDCLENRAVAAAVEVLIQSGVCRSETRKRLKSYLQRLPSEIVAAGFALRDFSKISVGRHNAHYERILKLSSLIMRFTSFSNSAGTNQQPAFLINMARLFEQYVGKVLTEGAQCLGLQVALQKSKTLDVGGQVNCKPDIIVTDLTGQRVVTVADTKYKNLSRDGVSQADAYQMLAYMAAFGSKDAVLVFPGHTDIDLPTDVITIDIGTSRFNVTPVTADLSLPVGELSAKLLAPFRQSGSLEGGKPLAA